MICPRCTGKIELSECEGASSNICPSCSGIWISGKALTELFADENEAPILLERFEALFDLDFYQSEVNCPSCVSRKLKAVNIEDTEIDFCTLCKGIFFDKGELEEVFSGKDGMMTNKITGAQVSDEGSIWETLLAFIGGARKTL